MKRIRAIGCLSVLVVFSVAYLPSLRVETSTFGRGDRLTLELRKPGSRAEYLEWRVAEPLERAIGAVRGVRSVRSTVEYGSVRTDITLNREVDAEQSAASIRSAAVAVHDTLSGEAHRPRLYAGSSSDEPTLILAVRSTGPHGRTPAQMRRFVEQTAQPRLERIEEVSRVQVLGGGTEEVLITVDPRLPSVRRHGLSGLNAQLLDASRITPIGEAAVPTASIAVLSDSRVSDYEQFARTRIDNDIDTARIAEVGSVHESVRRQETIARIDGHRAVTLSVFAANPGTEMSLSERVHAEITQWPNKLAIETDVLLDRGAEAYAALRSAVIATVVSLLALAVGTAILCNTPVELVRVVLPLPLSILLVLAIPAAAGHGVGTPFVAGIAVATTAGTSIVVLIGRSDPPPHAAPILASVATNSLALIPFLVAPELVPAATGLAQATILVSVTIVPVAYLVRNATGGSSSAPASLPAEDPPTRSIVVALATKHRRQAPWILAMSAFVTIAVFALVALRGFYENRPGYAHTSAYTFEHDTDASVARVDTALQNAVETLSGEEGISHIQSLAQRGAGRLLVIVSDQNVLERVAETVDSINAEQLAGRFHPAEGRHGAHETRILIYATGPDRDIARTLAREAAGALTGPSSGRPTDGQPAQAVRASRVLLHFREEPTVIALVPRRNELARSGLSAMDLARALRHAVSPPVSLKHLADGRETDVRVRIDSKHDTTDHLLETVLPVGTSGGMRLGQLVTAEISRRPHRIHRTGQEAAAYISATYPTRSLAVATAAARSSLNGIAPAAGYSIQVDESHDDEMALRRRRLRVVLSTSILIVLFIAAATESVRNSLVALAAGIVSCSFAAIPFLLRSGPVSDSVPVAVLVLFGSAVNGTILIGYDALSLAECNRSSPSLWEHAIAVAIAGRYRELSAAAGSTVVGVAPLLILLPENEVLGRTVAVAILGGTIGSIFVFAYLIPALWCSSKPSRRTTR